MLHKWLKCTTIERRKQLTLGRHTAIKLSIKCFDLEITNFKIMLRMSNETNEKQKASAEKNLKNNSDYCLNTFDGNTRIG